MLRISLELPLDHPVALQLLDQLARPVASVPSTEPRQGPSLDDLTTSLGTSFQRAAAPAAPAEATEAAPPKRGRGRPRKNPQPEAAAAAPAAPAAPAAAPVAHAVKPGVIEVNLFEGPEATAKAEPAAATPTKDDVRAAIQACGASPGGPAAVQAAFKSYQINRVSDLPETRYVEFIEHLNAISSRVLE